MNCEQPNTCTSVNKTFTKLQIIIQEASIAYRPVGYITYMPWNSRLRCIVYPLSYRFVVTHMPRNEAQALCSAHLMPVRRGTAHTRTGAWAFGVVRRISRELGSYDSLPMTGAVVQFREEIVSASLIPHISVSVRRSAPHALALEKGLVRRTAQQPGYVCTSVLVYGFEPVTWRCRHL